MNTNLDNVLDIILHEFNITNQNFHDDIIKYIKNLLWSCILKGLDISWLLDYNIIKKLNSVEATNDYQIIDLIYYGLESNLDVSWLANHKLNYFQAKEIFIGLQDGIDVSIFAIPHFFNEKQMNFIRLGISKGVDISLYANFNIDDKNMRRIYFIQCYNYNNKAINEKYRYLYTNDGSLINVIKEYILKSIVPEYMSAPEYIITIKDSDIENMKYLINNLEKIFNIDNIQKIIELRDKILNGIDIKPEIEKYITT